MNNLMTIKTSKQLAPMGVCISYLEENGIKCHLKDEFFGEMHPGIDIQLQVAETDVEEALKLLIEGGFATIEEYKEYSDPLTRFVNKIFDSFKGDEE